MSNISRHSLNDGHFWEEDWLLLWVYFPLDPTLSVWSWRRSSAAPPLFTGYCSLLSLFGLQRAAPDLSSKPTGRLAEARRVQGPACNWSLPWNAGHHAESLTPARERRRSRGTGIAGPPSLCDLIYLMMKIVHLGGLSENPLLRLWRQKLRFLSKQRLLLPKGTLCVYCGHMTEEAQC